MSRGHSLPAAPAAEAPPDEGGAFPPASTGRPERDALLRDLMNAMRQASGQGVMFSEAMAKRLGINPTDLECMGLLEQMGPLTAGRLAELTELTTGAITGVVDRLERRGYVERERDPDDRRRVIVRLLPDQVPQAVEGYQHMARGMAELCARYSDEELALVLDFFTRAYAVGLEATAKLRESDPAE